MILSGNEIRKRLKDKQIFTERTYDEDSIKEASYALRVARDGLMVEGHRYRPGKEFVDGDIKIEPGEIAILSTVERLCMPADLVGKIGIRFDYASLGLTGLMGIQVDPFFGWGNKDERLYIRVANLGNESVCIPPYKEVFTFELHRLSSPAPEPSTPRIPMWHRIQEILAGQREPSWSYVTRVQSNSDKAVSEVQRQLADQEKNLQDKLSSETESLRQNLQPLVMFGIFLVAVTILGVAISLIISVRETPAVSVPSWVTDWGWVILLVTVSVATITTGFMGGMMVYRLWKRE